MSSTQPAPYPPEVFTVELAGQVHTYLLIYGWPRRKGAEMPCDHYEVETLEVDQGRAFRLTKLHQPHGLRPSYDVLLEGELTSCECWGWLRWGWLHPCRHIAALTQMVEEGKL
jgi:hypothetical protein